METYDCLLLINLFLLLTIIIILIFRKKKTPLKEYDYNVIPEAGLFRPVQNKIYPVSVRLSFSDPSVKKKVNLVFGNKTIELPALGHQEIYEIPDNELNKNSIQGLFKLDKINTENSLKPIKKIMLFFQDDKNFIIREEILQNTAANMAGYTFRNKLPLLGYLNRTTPGVYITELDISGIDLELPKSYDPTDKNSPDYIPEFDYTSPSYNPRKPYIDPTGRYYTPEWDPNNPLYDPEQDPFIGMN
jgi:hypothetical protein